MFAFARIAHLASPFSMKDSMELGTVASHSHRNDAAKLWDGCGSSLVWPGSKPFQRDDGKEGRQQRKLLSIDSSVGRMVSFKA